jgi:N-methylhydantoinase A/oxoprolinase/acetone carboxylase beta subunit
MMRRGKGELATIYNYDGLAPGNLIKGPAIIERRDTAIFVPAENTAKMDGFRNIKIRIRR